MISELVILTEKNKELQVKSDNAVDTVHNLSREKEECVVTIAAKNQALTNLERHLKEKVVG